MKQLQQTGFADLAVSGRKIKDEFFRQIDTIIDWNTIEKEVNKCYRKGESVCGRPSYKGIVLFKICLLQTWNKLSDYQVEDQVNDRISFSRFAGIRMDSPCPDHSVISRFRTELTAKKAYERLFKAINKQLEAHKIMVKSGIIVDASVTDTLNKPKVVKEYEVVQDRAENAVDPIKAVEKVSSGVDHEARWLKKGGKLHYGFKKHIATDENGLVRGVVTTPANQSDIKHLEDVIDSVGGKASFDKGAWVKADKGYKSKENDTLLIHKQLSNHIMHKESKNRRLSQQEKQCNRLISGVRYKVERTFGGMKRCFGAGLARYVGLEKTHTQHLMEAIAYNLYRSPGIIMSNRLK